MRWSSRAAWFGTLGAPGGPLGVVTFVLGLWCVSSPLAANDAEMGGHGSDLVPLENTVIHMVSEDILLDGTSEGSQGWQVTARYMFENPTERTVPVVLGFPERVCLEPYDCGEAQRFAKMATRVRGVPVVHRVGQLSEGHPWAKQFGTIWLYDVEFRPREVVSIEHSYLLQAGGSVAGDRWVDYVTRTGAMWAGPIGDARFTFRVNYPALLLSLSDDPPLETVELRRSGEQAFIQVVLRDKAWLPRGDIQLVYTQEDRLLPWTASEPGQTSPAFDWERGAQRAGLPGAHCRAMDEARVYLAKSDRGFERLAREQASNFATSGSDLRICRNAIFARHGKIFDDPVLNRYFYGEPRPSGGKRRYFAWQPNPAFEVKQLFDTDWSTLQAIDWAIEQRRGQRRAASSQAATEGGSPAPAASDSDPGRRSATAPLESGNAPAAASPPYCSSEAAPPAPKVHASGGCDACAMSDSRASNAWYWGCLLVASWSRRRLRSSAC